MQVSGLLNAGPHDFPNLPDVGLLTLRETNGNSNGSGRSFRRDDSPFGIRLSLVGDRAAKEMEMFLEENRALSSRVMSIH